MDKKFLFFVPDTNGEPTSMIWDIYYKATLLKKNKHNVSIFTDNNDFIHPVWIEKELTDIDIIFPNQMEKNGFELKKDDVVFIPEYFVDIHDIFKKYGHIVKIVTLFHNRNNYFRSRKNTEASILMPLSNYYNVSAIIFNSEYNKKWYEDNLPNDAVNLDRYVIEPVIPTYFNYNNEHKEVKVALFGKNREVINNIVQTFYTRYPQFRFVIFEGVDGTLDSPKTIRKDFANNLKKYPVAVWVDRYSNNGLFPLECLAANTIPVCHVPENDLPYFKDFSEENNYNGLWTNTVIGSKGQDGYFKDVVEYINLALSMFLSDTTYTSKYSLEEYLEQPKGILNKYMQSETNDKKILSILENL